jgi:hypothetical protein
VELKTDLLEGVAAIADFTGLSARRVFYLASMNQLPIFKVGNRWFALRSALETHFSTLSGEVCDSDPTGQPQPKTQHSQ